MNPSVLYAYNKETNKTNIIDNRRREKKESDKICSKQPPIEMFNHKPIFS